ncbi:c-type cytochrome [Bradyrhizobium sp.]|uniref:c-type cytochrome n=1 Tax=Bradyrhizobium sp. TaxID=376 RepID=UPI002CBA880B|nr:cytochrome c [Bradyrhizobium sp.]HMM90339.1 cytochrome c [Bradyrhizobium sp.]
MRRSTRSPLWPELVVALVAATVPVSAEEIANAGKLANLVRQDCGSCHGLTLRGGLGKPLTSENLGAWNREQLVSIILDGVPGTPMPPWRALLSEGDARWIADRLQQGNLP